MALGTMPLKAKVVLVDNVRCMKNQKDVLVV